MTAPPETLRLPIVLWLASPLPGVLMPTRAGLELSAVLVAAMLGIIWLLRRPAPRLFDSTREALVARIARLVLPWCVVPLVAMLVIVLATPITRFDPIVPMAISVGLFTLGTLLYARALTRARAGWYVDHCPKCGYDITSCEVPICPECGRPITPAPDSPT